MPGDQIPLRLLAPSVVSTILATARAKAPFDLLFAAFSAEGERISSRVGCTVEIRRLWQDEARPYLLACKKNSTQRLYALVLLVCRCCRSSISAIVHIVKF